MKLPTVPENISICEESVPELLHLIANNPERGDDPFFVADLGDIILKYDTWNRLLPRVKPFYAVKCCPEPIVLRILESLGVNFDCASKKEIQAIEAICSCPSQRIIYANPCKAQSHLKYAAKKNIDLMTFDSIHELIKIKAIYPEARTVLRIKVDNEECVSELSRKYGASLKVVPDLLQKAKELDLEIVGVSFHVGSGCSDLNAFSRAISDSKWVFEEAISYGYNMQLLDIGGGYPGDDSDPVKFVDVAKVINKALDIHFPVGCSVDLIAEPGRFFVSSAFTLCANIIGKKTGETTYEGKPDVTVNQYYINEGVYGALNCVLYENRNLNPYPLKKRVGEKLIPSIIWGPTCDSMDEISCNYLPDLEDQEWLVFDNAGAYTICAASRFNGFEKTEVHYFGTNCYRPHFAKLGKENVPTLMQTCCQHH